jgi:F0F1-type ATP synthase delta subunit
VAALDGATKPQVESVAEELVAMLAAQHEGHRVRGVIAAVEDAWRERYGAATVKIETAHPLSATLRKKLESLAPGAEVVERVRPQIIGGARLRIDETIIDGTIEGQLAHLNQALSNA